MMSKPVRTGIVLSSGGVRGVFAHTGFMQTLQQLGIHIDAIAGCSAGALVGGLMASGTRLEDWIKALDSVNSHTFWEPDSLSRCIWEMAVHKGRGYTGLSSTLAAQEFISRNLRAQMFEDCIYPFHALAINLGSGRKTMFSKGRLAPRIIASAAIPILYEPVKIGNEYYCDGALIDFAPTDAICYRHQLDLVIVHHVSQSFGPQNSLDAALQGSWSILEIINRLMFREQPWYLSEQPLSLHRCPCGCGAVVVVVAPRLPSIPWPDIKGGQQTLRSAQRQARALLKPCLEPMLHDPRNALPIPQNSVPVPGRSCIQA